MTIINEGASYGASGLGSTDWIKNFAATAQITDPVQINAIRTLYESCVSAGIWDKIYGIAFFPGSTPATQKYIFSKVPVGGSFKELVFTGNGSSEAGWTPGPGVYAKAPFSPPAGSFAQMSFGVYNNTAETAPASGVTRLALSLRDNVAPANIRVALSRYYQSGVISPIIQLGNDTSPDQAFPASGSYDVAKTGFLQGVRDGNAVRLIDDGATIFTNNSANQTITGGGSINLHLGVSIQVNNQVNAGVYSQARMALAYWGKLGFAEAVTFNVIVNTFIAAMGRA